MAKVGTKPKGKRLLDLSPELARFEESYEFGRQKDFKAPGLPDNALYSVWKGLPLPVSENELYVNASHGGRRMSYQGRWFKNQMRVWALNNVPIIWATREWLTNYYEPTEQTLKIHVKMHCKKSRLFTQSGLPRRYDGQNFLKALIDCVSELIGVDDSHFFKVEVIKSVTRDENEGVTVTLSELNGIPV